jgi:glycosyltransferase involved in cell wall biosynthesis
MKTSVIIPIYNGSEFLSECLKSVYSQSKLPDEIIIIDDASSESYDHIIDNFRSLSVFISIKLIKLQKNQGQAAARNAGIKECAGDWIAFLDHDDVWDPCHLEQLEKYAISMHADIIFCPAKLFTGSLNNIISIAGPRTKEEIQTEAFSLMKNCFIITSSCLINKSIFKELGGFDEHSQIRGVEDLDLFLRMLRNKSQFRMAPNATLYYRKHQNSATCRPAGIIRQKCAVIDKHIDWVNASNSEKCSYRNKLYWQAAIETAISSSSDRWVWFKKAMALNIKTPITLPISLARYIKKTLFYKSVIV